MIERAITVDISDLPSYVYCDVDGCTAKHYLSLNRNVQGLWAIAYLEFDTNMACLFVNDAETVAEAALRMHYSLKRHNYQETTNEDSRNS